MYIFEPLKEDELLTPRSTFSIHLCIPSDICWHLFCLNKTSKVGAETITVASRPGEGPEASNKQVQQERYFL